MKTTIYLVRHCQPNFENHIDNLRELTENGLNDSLFITDFLINKNVDIIYSSPYKRCLQTIEDFSNKSDLKINKIENFKERNIGMWVDDFNSFSKKQWSDFNYKLENGESLKEVQNRFVKSFKTILQINKNKNIVISSHGTAISTLINYYDNNFKYENFVKIKNIMPFIAIFKFEKEKLVSYEIVDVLKTKEV